MKDVDELAALSHKEAACTHDIINYAPTINTYCYLIYNLKVNVNYYSIVLVQMMYIATFHTPALSIIIQCRKF